MRIGGRLFEDRTDVGGIADDPALRWQMLREGRFPDGPGEVVADVNAVKGHDVAIGDWSRSAPAGARSRRPWSVSSTHPLPATAPSST